MTLFGIPLEFILFAATLLGVALLHNHTLVWGFFCQGVSGWLISGPVAMLGALSTGRRRSTVTSQAATACG
jgi:hypothetical protein